MQIIFYDGYCALCNNFIRALIRFDSKEQFYFSSLQSDRAQKLFLENPALKDIDSIILQIENGSKSDYFTRGAAVRKIIHDLSTAEENSFFNKSILKLSKFAITLWPDYLLEKSYELVASNRYKIFGKYDTCPLPDPTISKRFLN